MLNNRLSDYMKDPTSVQSFLVSIVGGDFTAYQVQRDALHRLYYGPNGQSALTAIPPPPPPTTLAPPPPPSARTGSVRYHRRSSE